MAYTTINDPELYFQARAYTGNGGTQSITLDGDNDLSPNFVWIKNRDGTDIHALYDSVRGANKNLRSDETSAEGSQSDGLTSFDSDGFSVGAAGSVNTNTNNFASWSWKEDATAGFDIVTYTGDGQANRTVDHSLGVTPEQIWFKRRDSTNNWINYDKTLGTGHYLTFNLNGTTDSASGAWCTPGSSNIQLNQVFSATNTNTATYVAYCFASVQGYSKVGTYKGNGNSDGTFVYTGFRPAFLIYKNTDTADNWFIHDNKRQGYNDQNELLLVI